MTEDVALRIKLDAAESAVSVKDLKKSILDLKNASLEAAAAGNKALADKFAQGAATAKDRINDLNKQINILGDTGSKLQAVAKIGGTIASGFAAAQGAAALFGASTDEVQKQLLKVQAAMALVQGFQGFAEGIKIVKGLSVETKIAGLAMQVFGTESAAAMAAATGGITLLAAGLVTLIATFDSWKNSLTGTLSSIEKFRKEHEKIKPVIVDIAEVRKKDVIQLQAQLDLAKAQGKSAWELYDIESKLLNVKIQQAKAELDYTKIDIFASDSRKNAALKAYQDLTNQKIALDTQYNKTVTDAYNKKQDEEKQAKEQMLADLDEIKQSTEDKYQIEIDNLEKKKQKFKDDKVDDLTIETWYNEQLTKIHLEQAQDEADKLEKLKQGAKKVQITEGAGAGVVDTSIADAQKTAAAIEKAKWDVRLKVAQQGTAALISLNETVTAIEIRNAHGGEAQIEKIRKQSFNRNKELQIVGAIISGIQAVQSIMATSSLIPEPANAIFKAAEIGVSIATTVANIAKIASTQYTGSGNASGGGATPSTPSASGVNINNSQLQSTLLGQQQNNTNNPPQRVYVLEHDITHSQHRVKVYEEKGMIH